MEPKLEAQAGVMVIHPPGTAITRQERDGLKSILIDLVSEGYDRVVIDLSAVRRIDSSGLGVLVGMLRILGPNGTLALCSVNPSISALLNVTNLATIFPTYRSAEEAVDALGDR